MPLTVDFGTIAGIKKAVQVFPNTPGLDELFIVYLEDDKLEEVKNLLEADDGIVSCELVPIRKLS